MRIGLRWFGRSVGWSFIGAAGKPHGRVSGRWLGRLARFCGSAKRDQLTEKQMKQRIDVFVTVIKSESTEIRRRRMMELAVVGRSLGYSFAPDEQ